MNTPERERKTYRLRINPVLALLLTCAAGCATPTSADTGNAMRGSAAVKPATAAAVPTAGTASWNQDITPPTTTAATATPERKGLDAALVWRPSLDPRRAKHATCSMTYAQLLPGEVRADSNWLYIDVTHKGAGPEATHPGTSPEVELLLDQCPARAPRASGSVWRDWATPSTVTIALTELPDGELDLLVRAFGSEFVLPLKKEGQRVSYLRLDQRKGYSYRPGDPARGIPPEVGLEDPACPTAEVHP